MARRTKDVSGFVNFPVDDLPSSNEGGMFVRLVVEDNGHWVQCSGGANVVIYDECYLGDDSEILRPIFPDFTDSHTREQVMDLMGKYEDDNRKWTQAVFPRFDDRDLDGIEKYISIYYLAVMTIGSTGWSNGEWRCTRDDLTPEGKALIESLEKLYPGCSIRLQTWLDT